MISYDGLTLIILVISLMTMTLVTIITLVVMVFSKGIQPRQRRHRA